MRKRTFEFF